MQNEKWKDKYVDQIDKDIPRTHTECPTFTMNIQFQ